MRLTKSLLKQIVKEELLNSQGLTTDFQEDDTVKDINPDCPHFNSQGIVIKVTPNEVTYRVTNNGKTYKDGDELTKSTDQLVKLNTNDIEEDFSVGNRKDRVSQTKKTAEVLGHEMVGEVEEPSFDLTKNKDRGDNLGESVSPLTEIKKTYYITGINTRGKLKDILPKAINRLRGAKILDIARTTGPSLFIKMNAESKYMDVLGDFIKKYDKKKDIVIIDQHKTVVYNGKKGINKLREAKLNEEKYVVASVYGDLYTPKAVPEKQAKKLMMKLAKQYAGDNVFMLGVKAWNKPHKYNKKRIKVKEGVLLEKKELDSKSVKKVAQMTDRNNHTEARIFLSAKMGWKKGIKFYKAMMDINDVFNGYPGGASQLNNMMEKELYREMLRTWSNYDDIYNSL